MPVLPGYYTCVCFRYKKEFQGEPITLKLALPQAKRKRKEILEQEE